MAGLRTPGLWTSGVWASGLPPQPAYFPYGPPPQKPRSKVGWLLGAVAVVAVALAGVVVYWLFFSDSKTAGTAGSAIAGEGSEHSSATVASLTPCSAPPKFTGESVTQSSAGLAVSATMTSACPEGDIVSNSNFQVAVTTGGKDVAAASFDLSRAPIVLPKSQSAKVSLVFPAGSYWRPADMAAGPLALSASLLGNSATVPDGGVRNPSTLTASGPGVPTNGSADDAALAALEDIAAADATTLRDTLQGRWLPQISSKKVGLVADDITWTNIEILREFLDNRARYGEALLLWSGEWATFDSPESYWVTVVGKPMPTAESALSWCTGNQLDREHCLAKIVNEYGASQGTTKHQPR